MALLAAQVASADTLLRIATYAAPFSRKGPGLLLRDLGREDSQIDAALAVIAHVDPDVLVLTDLDYDLDGFALQALNARLPAPFAHFYAGRPNSGMMTRHDLDLNGKTGEPRDAQGYGRFAGDGGLAVLSRWPIGAVTDLSDLLWRDLPGATLPLQPDGSAWPQDLADIQRLSSTAHWIVPVDTPDGPLSLLAFSATPPVFDGPEDRNGLRNRDELRLWSAVLDGGYGPPPASFVVIGNANLDPADGQGLRDAMQAFLGDPRLQDPHPRSAGGELAADPTHIGDPGLDTADWSDDGPGNLRVSYVLPSVDWQVADAGVFWPAPDDPSSALLGDDGLAAGPHHLVWVDISR